MTKIPYKDWPEPKKAASRAYQRAHRRKKYGPNGERVQKYNLASRFGISMEDYDRLFSAQDGLCAICRRPESAKSTGPRGGLKRLGVDHSHQTGQIRGLLCCNCNSGLGAFQDDVSRLASAAIYLQSFVPPASSDNPPERS